MSYRVHERVGDELRNNGKKMYTVYEVQPDGTEKEILETRDRDAVENLVEGEEREWSEEKKGVDSHEQTKCRLACTASAERLPPVHIRDLDLLGGRRRF